MLIDTTNYMITVEGTDASQEPKIQGYQYNAKPKKMIETIWYAPNGIVERPLHKTVSTYGYLPNGDWGLRHFTSDPLGRADNIYYDGTELEFDLDLDDVLVPA